MTFALVKGMVHRRCITAAVSNIRNDGYRKKCGHVYQRTQSLVPLVSRFSFMMRHDGWRMQSNNFSTATSAKSSTFETNHLQKDFRCMKNAKHHHVPISWNSNSPKRSQSSTSATDSTKCRPGQRSLQPPPNIQPMDKRLLFQYLRLREFTPQELERAFSEIQQSLQKDEQHQNLFITEKHVAAFLMDRIREMDDQFEEQMKESNTYNSKVQREGNEIAATYNYPDKEDEIQIYSKAEAQSFVAALRESHSQILNIFRLQSLSPPQFSRDEFGIDRTEFIEKITKLASELDASRTLPISLSMLLVGSSVGIVIPIMPYVVSDLGLTAGQYGLVVSSFAFAKLFANVPAAIFAEKHGRKPYLVYSLVIISMGVGGVGLASQFEHLVICRILTGVGVSALSTAATLTMSDCSTPLNRASTMAPMMSAFSAGTALGPAIGGYLADKIGVTSTFYLVGCSYLGLTLLNEALLTETKMAREKDRRFPWQEHYLSSRSKRKSINISKETDESGVLDTVKDAFSQWSPLLADPKVRSVVVMNGFYWAALSGSQMTLLPLILTDPSGLALTATSLGKVYMGMSLVQVLGNPTMAKFVDKMGKVPGIIIGCSLLSGSMFILPLCTDMTQVSAALGCWALGSTMLSTSPVSYISDRVKDSKRAQAIALLRTVGDIGFLIGASGAGALADHSSMKVAMHSSAGLLLTATSWFSIRRLLAKKSPKL